MKKAYLSASLSALCFATLGTCVTAVAASHSGAPLVTPYALSAVPRASMDGRRSLPMLQAVLGQWATSSRVRYSANDKVSQAYRTVKIEQTARMQAPLNWLNAMTLRLTTNRHVLAGFLDISGHDLSSEWVDEKDRSQPQK